MVWFIVAAALAAVIAFVAFRASGKEPMKEPAADEQRDGRDRMV